MSSIQLNDAIPVETPLGKGRAIIFESYENDNYWTVVLNETGAIVTFKQPQIRVARNYSVGRRMSAAEMMELINAGRPVQEVRDR